uniref:DUF1593 domain-containing protein n=1 Tax=Roseihalotalea indica TaxID=2867963 RepID=A0AA49GI24_9BACT|nr:DUF1593 domain-containing protein [Tunicatimonas sp. TK19036]
MSNSEVKELSAKGGAEQVRFYFYKCYFSDQYDMQPLLYQNLMKNFKITSLLILAWYCLPFLIAMPCHAQPEKSLKPRILISTDIGGTDPDDFQSMIHFLMYADLFQTQGLISSPYGPGRKDSILKMIDLYEQDLPKLQAHSNSFPSPSQLRSITKQGATELAPFKGWSQPTEGSEWIIKCAQSGSDQPLWVLVWGGIEDLAQALHDAPNIKKNIRVYWIGGPNKKWSVNAYAYIAEHHPDLWMIEANATYRGWFMDGESPENLKDDRYYAEYIRQQGTLGRDFKNYYEGVIKMGDTPSLTYVMHGEPDDPLGESWGGSFEKINHSARRIFERNTTLQDTVPVYSVIEWHFSGPVIDIPADSACFTLNILGQSWPGYYRGDGRYAVRYSPKRPEICPYTISSDLVGFTKQTGTFVSANPWPGTPSPQNYPLKANWYSDKASEELFIDEQQGARTVAQWREAFLLDWAKRWDWLK